ncbi:MAG TPA: class I SAM-dependent methyltransferase [Azospirillum sp.]|nr:class I SAM-dependent methyltransferase [Azospirillum sp.]
MTDAAVHAGQAAYKDWVLRWVYDFWVLGVSNHWIWKCPTARLRAQYDANLSANHLDVGVGTGYYLGRCRFPSPAPRLALMDLNPNSLKHAGAGAARHAPELLRRNVLAPIAYDGRGFDSVGLMYLLHCLPGRMAEKAVAFDHLRPLMNPGAVVFGATLVQGDAPRSRAAQRLMDVYNAKGVFSNRDDTVAGLRAELAKRFARPEVELVGCAAVFRAVAA